MPTPPDSSLPEPSSPIPDASQPESSRPASALPDAAQARRLAELARKDRSAARAELSDCSLDEQVALVCQATPARRARLVQLVDSPEELVPALPEAELCYTVKGLGLPDAGWLLELATSEQIVACVDLDAWQEFAPDPEGLAEWIVCLADAGSETLTRAARALDPELLTLFLARRIEVMLKPQSDDFEPPEGSQTLDGQFFFRARLPDDALADVQMLLRGTFEADYWSYFRLMQSVVWELSTETEEWALRWRTGRMLDLGFPPWEEAMAIYGLLPPAQLAALAEAASPAAADWSPPIFVPELAAPGPAAPLLFQAMASLPEDRRHACSQAFVGLANCVAVADRMPLGDAESIPKAFARAAELASRGLAFLADAHGLEPAQVLERSSPAHLFRVGFNLGAG